MSFKEKYIEYKQKYLNLKLQYGSSINNFNTINNFNKNINYNNLIFGINIDNKIRFPIIQLINYNKKNTKKKKINKIANTIINKIKIYNLSENDNIIFYKNLFKYLLEKLIQNQINLENNTISNYQQYYNILINLFLNNYKSGLNIIIDILNEKIDNLPINFNNKIKLNKLNNDELNKKNNFWLFFTNKYKISNLFKNPKIGINIIQKLLNTQYGGIDINLDKNNKNLLSESLESSESSRSVESLKSSRSVGSVGSVGSVESLKSVGSLESSESSESSDSSNSSELSESLTNNKNIETNNKNIKTNNKNIETNNKNIETNNKNIETKSNYEIICSRYNKILPRYELISTNTKLDLLKLNNNNIELSMYFINYIESKSINGYYWIDNNLDKKIANPIIQLIQFLKVKQNDLNMNINIQKVINIIFNKRYKGIVNYYLLIKIIIHMLIGNKLDCIKESNDSLLFFPFYEYYKKLLYKILLHVDIQNISNIIRIRNYLDDIYESHNNNNNNNVLTFNNTIKIREIIGEMHDDINEIIWLYSLDTYNTLHNLTDISNKKIIKCMHNFLSS